MLTIALRAYRRLTRAIPSLTDPLNRGIGALCTAALGEDEKTELTRFCYQSSYHLLDGETGALFPWEHDWFTAELPPAPASILVPAAGGGREMVALENMGYAVYGFDPAVQDSPNRNGVVRGSFRDLLTHRGGHLQLPGAFEKPVDAIVFGWGSLSHLYTAEARRTVLHAATECCPNGPVLLSYWAETDAHRTSRALNAMRTLGQGIARVRGMNTEGALACDFTPNAGLATHVSSQELMSYAEELSRRIRFGTGAYAHATLL